MAETLRAPLGSFFGRVQDMLALRESYRSEGRLLTITGPGGIGKTRLAHHFIHVCQQESTEDETSGLWMTDLSEVTTHDELCDAMEAMLQIPQPRRSSREGAVERIGRALAGHTTALVVLDSFDRCVELAEGTIGRWLSMAPEVRFLITSREQLHLPGEHVYELRPLSLPDECVAFDESEAVSLFVESARRANPRWSCEDAEAAYVTAIVSLLDGNPLAIELAATRLAVMGPRALLHRLRSRFDILRKTHRGVAGRHDTLAATMEFSWTILQPWEREALAQCAVFRGGFTLEASEAVLELHPDAPLVMDVIQTLRDKSLLLGYEPRGLAGELRLGMYETIRDYARERLAEMPHQGDVEQRHAAFTVEEAERRQTRRGGGGASASYHLLAERQNLLAVAERVLRRGPVTASSAEPALRALLVLEPVLLHRGPLEKYSILFEPVLEATARSGADPLLYCRALASRGRMLLLRGRGEQGLKCLIQGLDIAGKLGDDALRGRIELQLAIAMAERGEHAQAQQHAEQSLAVLGGAGDGAARGRATRCLAEITHHAGQHDEAYRLLEQTLVAHAVPGAELDRVADLQLQASFLLDQGETERAQASIHESLLVAGQVEDRRGEAVARGLQALAHHVRGELDQARLEYEEAIVRAARLGFGRLEAATTGHLAILALELGQTVEARALLTRARQLLEGDTDAELYALHEVYREGLDARSGRSDALREIVRRVENIFAHSVQVRLARRCLQATLAGDQEEHRPTLPSEDLVVGAGGNWFRAPSGERVNLAHRKPLRLLLQALMERRIAQPAVPMPWDEALEAGWPGERVIASAGAHRVRVAISTLRKFGLRDVLQTHEGGYLLDPDVAGHLLD